MILEVDKYNPNREKMEIAAEAIKKGELVAFPTETVYGLGANALDSQAVLGIFAAKGRPSDNPLIVHVASADDVDGIAVVNDLGRKLMQRFWPGPLTLIFPARDNVPAEVTAGLGTVGVRMPLNAIAKALIEMSGVPIAAPSANKSGRPSPTNAMSVYEDLSDAVSVILDGGPTEVGVESTVIDVTGKDVFLLRAGGLPVEKIMEVTGHVQLPRDQNMKKRSPGTRYRHYAPLIPLVLCENGFYPDELRQYDSADLGYLGVHEPPVAVGQKIMFPDIDSYARGLFTSMRVLEKSGICVIIAEYPGKEGVGLALRDRLKRAAGY